jgi:microcystin-dependent protein
MAQPYLGEIEAFAFDYAPRGWMQCQGQLLSISQNQALFAVIGTAFGGNGVTTFALPDLRGRLAMGQGSGYTVGQTLGEENHTILFTEMPSHNHLLMTAPNGQVEQNVDTPGPSVTLGPATATKGTSPDSINPYATVPPAPTTAMSASAIAMTNGGQAHSNIMPYLAINFCIALSGIFPSRA